MLRALVMARSIAGLRNETNARFDQVDQRFEQVDQRFEQVDQRFERVDQRFGQLDRRFEQQRDDWRHDLAALRDELKRDDHETRILVEAVDHKVGVLAEAVAGNSERIERLRNEVQRELGEQRGLVTESYRQLDVRVTALEQASSGSPPPTHPTHGLG